MSRTRISTLAAAACLRHGESYRLGFFLVGAYQEILGDIHNLFGDTDAIEVRIEGDGYPSRNSARAIPPMSCWITSVTSSPTCARRCDKVDAANLPSEEAQGMKLRWKRLDRLYLPRRLADRLKLHLLPTAGEGGAKRRRVSLEPVGGVIDLFATSRALTPTLSRSGRGSSSLAVDLEPANDWLTGITSSRLT